MRCLLCLTLSACGLRGDDADTAPLAEECGDLDGVSGTDTGNLPNILGNWTTIFANQLDYENCGITGLKPSDMHWIDGAALEIDGTPPGAMVSEFASVPEERFYGIVSTYGGVVFSGIHYENDYELHVSFGGLLFYNDLLGRDEIKGHAYLGLDSNDDGYLDCGLQGDFTAYKSGS